MLELALHAQESTSRTIGPYKLLQPLGEGGFGIVWMAEQETPVRRRVALKVIKSGMDTREVIARFETERQALAMMEHPNIARVFDAGETGSGRPYFVMELVRGVPITKYCDDHRVPTEARLRLFIAVCQAVQHAHQKGIIHRDLKPSNILVALEDGKPRVKVIDFGIAKAVETRLTDKTLFTQFHAFIGTPAYTSPEQMELSGLDVDTRSDIYSLGVLLYELLTGRPPFDPEVLLKSSLEDMRRTIREVDPPRPSLRVRTYSEDFRTTVARERGIDAAKLSLRLRGDLDCIVMCCLEKDRTRRYDTANALAADVQRFLNDESVAARPPSAVDHLHKFIRRHRLGFAAGLAIAVALLVGLVATSVWWVRERAARERAVAAETTQSALRQKSEQVARFMTDMLHAVGPSVALGRDTALLRDILEATAQRLDTDLRDQPAVAAELRDTLGVVYCDLREYPAAEPLLREAVAARRVAFGNESAETAASLLHLGTALGNLHRLPEAENALREALAVREKRFGADDPLVADVLYQLTWVFVNSGRGPLARTTMEKTLAIRRAAWSGEHPSIAEAISGLALLEQRDLRHEPAARLHAEALEMRRRVLGNEHPDVAASLDGIGFCYSHVLERKRDAALAYGEAFTIRRKMLGDRHPRVIVSLLRFAGQLRSRDANPAELALVRGFVASQRQVLPHGSVLLAPGLLALASLEDLPDRRPEEARAWVSEAQALLAMPAGGVVPLDAEIIDAMYYFAWSKFIANVPAEGLLMSELSVQLANALPVPSQRPAMFPTHTLAWIHLALGHHDEAARHFETAVRLCRALLGKNHPITLTDVAALADCYHATNRGTEARQILEEVITSLENAPVPESEMARMAFIYGQLGLTLLDEARYADAEATLRTALRLYDYDDFPALALRLRPPARIVTGLGRALASQERFAEAEPLLEQAIEELSQVERSIAGDRDRLLGEAFDAVIGLYDAWRKPQKAAEWRAKRGAELTGHP